MNILYDYEQLVPLLSSFYTLTGIRGIWSSSTGLFCNSGSIRKRRLPPTPRF